LGLGCGYTLIVVVMLLLSYLPGALPRWLVVLTFDLLLVALLGLGLGRTSTAGKVAILPETQPPRKQETGHWLALGLLLVLLIGGYLRFANLGYAEFLTDEARVVLRAQAVLQGDENILFVHRKGPTEILLPATIWSMTGGIDEFTARLPFAIASLAGLFAIFCLGRRLYSPLVGWVAALLLVFDGYLIGFARFTQYQSVVLFTTALVILLLYALVQPQGQVNSPLPKLQTAGRPLSLAAALWATGLLSHYDALLTAVPAGWLLAVLLWQHRQTWPQWWRSLGLALLVGASLLALFYPPFLLHPHFQATYTYLLDRRIAAGGLPFPYNNLADVFQRSVIYNSAYAMILLIVLVLVALVFAYRRGWGQSWATYVGGALILLVGVTLLRPAWLRFGTLDLTVLPWTLALLGVWLAPRLALPERLLWLWFGLLALLALFFVSFPRTHVYTFFTPWALLVGSTVAHGWQWLRRRTGQGAAAAIGVLVTASAGLLFGSYAYWYFVDHQVEVLRTWQQNHPAGYWLPTGTQQSDALYGFPLQNGWKTIGVLYEQGRLQGDYETNQRDNLISQWYTRGQNRCAATAQWYFHIDSLETWSSSLAVDEQLLQEQGYRRWGQVTVNGAPRLTIYQLNAAAQTEQTLALADYAAQFDQLVRTSFPLQYPAIEPPISNPVRINFGDQIWLEGYAVAYPQPLRPGATVRLTLFWRAQRANLPDYKVFNHVRAGDGALLTQRDGHPVCERQRTSTWYPGELVVDRYDMALPADTPLGAYTIYTGLYREADLRRLPVLDAQGAALEEQVQLADLLIEGAP
jgi:4-amino-4-deoxy-L-arabinose transferase-like glycosyltransferase